MEDRHRRGQASGARATLLLIKSEKLLFLFLIGG